MGEAQLTQSPLGACRIGELNRVVERLARSVKIPPWDTVTDRRLLKTYVARRARSKWAASGPAKAAQMPRRRGQFLRRVVAAAAIR